MRHRWRVIRLAITGGTGLLMVTTVVVLVLRKSQGFGGEFFLALLVALLPSAIFALTGPEQRRVLVWGTVHVVLVVALALLYLIGTGPFGFIYAFLLYFAALATSIVATVDREGPAPVSRPIGMRSALCQEGHGVYGGAIRVVPRCRSRGARAAVADRLGAAGEEHRTLLCAGLDRRRAGERRESAAYGAVIAE